MLDLLGEALRSVGSTSDAANASGSVLARLQELLANRLTSTRAGKLDNANAAITSRLSGSIINSIQQGSITIAASNSSNTATITSVTTSKSAVIWLGDTNDIASGTGTGSAQRRGYVQLTNATTVTATRSAGGISDGNTIVNFMVIEFK